MTLKRRIERLTEKTPPPANERPTEIFLVGICPESKEAVSAHAMFGGHAFERKEGESEAEFIARFDGAGMDPTNPPKGDI